MKKLFIFQQDIDPYKDELVCAEERINGDKSSIDFDDLSIDYLLNESIEVVISNGLPIEWYFLLKGMNIVSITIGEMEKHYYLADITIDYKSNDNSKYFTGKDASICRNKNLIIDQIANLLTKLEWDSNFFGYNVALLSCLHLTDNIYNRIEQFINRESIRLVEYPCNCHDNRSVKVAEKNGFHFTDIRITFGKKISQRMQPHLPQTITFKKAQKKHIPRLREISKDLYIHSRYMFDENFDKDKINEFYQGWAEKGVLGQFDDECWCLFKKGTPVAFCTLRYKNNSMATIGLLGLDEKYQGKGLGEKLLQSVFNLLMENGIKNVIVVTQGRNYAAQNLYQSVGFRTKTTQLWYHKWI